MGLSEGSVASIGFRLLGREAAVRWQGLGGLITELVKAKHIEVHKGELGERQGYRIITPLFALETTSKPHVCAECARQFKRLPKSGVCKSCQVEGERIDKYRAAHARLGPEATHSEIVKSLDGEETDQKWLKIARQVELISEVNSLAKVAS